MRARLIVLGGFLVSAGSAACFSSSSGGGGPDASFEIGTGPDGFGGDDATTDDAGPDAQPTDATAADTSTHVPDGASSPDANDAAAGHDAAVLADGGDAGGSLVRVANMASGLAGGVDFCVAPPGGGFAGPYMLAQGVATGIPYKGMSEYAVLAPESSFKVRVVAAGSASCTTGLVADVTTGPSTAANPTSVVLAGSAADDGGAPLTLQAFVDDSPSTTPLNNRTRFRVIHEAPGLGSATFQIGATPYVIPVQTGVPYGATFAASTQSTGAVVPDAQGYVLPGMGSEQVELVLGGGETLSFYLTAASNSNATDSMTAFLVGTQGSSADPLGFAACDELTAPAGHLAACTFENGAPKTVPVRVLHASPDQAPIDICVQVGTLPITSGLLATAGISTGVSFLQLSGVLTSIPAGTDLGVSFAVAGQSCATASFTGLGTSLFYDELTLTLAEATLPPGTTYQVNIVDTGTPGNANAAIATVTTLAPSGGASYDFFDTENGQSELPIGSGPLHPYNTLAGLSFTPDTYALRVADDATKTTVYMRTGFALGAAQTYLLAWFDAATPSPGAVALCPLGSRGAASITTCGD